MIILIFLLGIYIACSYATVLWCYFSYQNERELAWSFGWILEPISKWEMLGMVFAPITLPLALAVIVYDFLSGEEI